VSGRILALAGGVGGARLAHGLVQALAGQGQASDLAIVVNTGDDFEHLGLAISPDLDTVVYTLAGLGDPVRGWGLAGETWQCMQALAMLGGEDWFSLGDRDLALHLLRSQRLREGLTLEAVTATVAARLGIAAAVAPMSNDPVRTRIGTAEGELAFQDYFVRRRCEPRVESIRYQGAGSAQPSALLAACLDDPDLQAVILCPSNPWLSIGPMLAMPALDAWFEARRRLAPRAPVVAVSPIIAGAAVKGPAARVMDELGITPGVLGVCDFYGDRVDGWVIDRADAALEPALRSRGKAVLLTDALMRDEGDRARLATETVALAERIRAGRP
jgi:LPPG:FO 2-phospho-L-lactate transferase